MEQREYDILLLARKGCRECMTYGRRDYNDGAYWRAFCEISNNGRTSGFIINPSCIPNERNVPQNVWNPNIIGFWENWQGRLNARIMVIGQDWGSVEYYQRHGVDESIENNKTNERLVELISLLGVHIGMPGEHIEGEENCFFTNAILCLKSGNLQARLMDSWFTKCRQYLARIIHLVNPEILIGLGRKATNSIE